MCVAGNPFSDVSLYNLFTSPSLLWIILWHIQLGKVNLSFKKPLKAQNSVLSNSQSPYTVLIFIVWEKLNELFSFLRIPLLSWWPATSSRYSRWCWYLLVYTCSRSVTLWTSSVKHLIEMVHTYQKKKLTGNVIKMRFEMV